MDCMADPMSGDAFLAECKRLGVDIKEVPGWRTRNRSSTGLPWGPVHGVMLHHTVTKDTKTTVEMIKNGRPDLDGPLYAVAVDESGTAHLIGWGRCNHAGRGDDDVLRAVIAERPGPLPSDDEANTDGNRHFYGFAFINMGDGRDPYSPEQIITMSLLSYIIVRHHHWTERSIIGHGHWQPGKIDPAPHPGMTVTVASRVGAWLKTGSPAVPGAPKPPPPAQPKPPTLASLAADVRRLTARVQDLESWRNGR